MQSCTKIERLPRAQDTEPRQYPGRQVACEQYVVGWSKVLQVNQNENEMSEKMELIERLAGNLKAFNAKERDHFMRFAYLGQVEPYQGSRTFLSKPFLDALWRKLSGGADFPNDAECLFAGMDYHLDWLFTAMYYTAKGKDAVRAFDEEPKLRSNSPNDLDLHLVSGNQEDVDLLISLLVDDRPFLVFVEAKGDATFNRIQLTRKLIRVSNAIRESRLEGCEFRYVLASPVDPTLRISKNDKALPNYAELTKPRKPCKFHDKLTNLLDEGNLKFNKEVLWIDISGFPKKGSLMKVERCGKDYSHWRASKR